MQASPSAECRPQRGTIAPIFDLAEPSDVNLDQGSAKVADIRDDGILDHYRIVRASVKRGATSGNVSKPSTRMYTTPNRSHARKTDLATPSSVLGKRSGAAAHSVPESDVGAEQGFSAMQFLSANDQDHAAGSGRSIPLDVLPLA